MSVAAPTELAPALPPALAQSLASRDFANLSVLLRHAARGGWAFALYNSPGVRESVMAALPSAVAPLPVYEWTFAPNQPDALGYLNAIPVRRRAERVVVFILDLEHAGDAIWKALDYQREAFAQYPHFLVFWITSAGRIRAARHAPNFWAQRSGVFDFTIAQPAQLAEARQLWIGADLRLESYDDAVRQLRLYQGLLDDYLAQPETAPATLRDLYTKVAWLLNFLDRRDEAFTYLKDELALAEQNGDGDWRAEALNNLAEIEAIRSGAPTALAHLNQALELASTPNLRARILLNLGSTLYQQGEPAKSLDLLERALTLFKQVGDKLGEANVRQAMGDVLQFRKEMDAALTSYEQALTLFQQVGSKLGEANVYTSQGQLYLVDDPKRAEALLNRAIQIYHQVGSRYSIPAQIGNFGWTLLQIGEKERARPYLLRAAELFEQMNLLDYAERHRRAAQDE